MNKLLFLPAVSILAEMNKFLANENGCLGHPKWNFQAKGTIDITQEIPVFCFGELSVVSLANCRDHTGIVDTKDFNPIMRKRGTTEL